MSVFKLFLSKDSIEFGNEKYNQVFSICGEWYSKKVKQTMKLTLLEVFQVDKMSIILFDEIQASFIGKKVFFYRNSILWEVCMKNFNFESAFSNYLAKLTDLLILIQVRDCKLFSYECFTKELQKHNKCSMRLNFLFSCIIFRLLL